MSEAIADVMVWRSRWLPALVFSLFVVTGLAALFGNDPNLIDEQWLEVSFIPTDAGSGVPPGTAIEIVDALPVGATERGSVVEVSAEGFRVLVPGTLVVRFRAPDAGSNLELDYRFGHRRLDASCELSLARVASRHGVDYMCRRSLVANKHFVGIFRHDLGDHTGWFELSLDVNRAATEIGFEIGRPEIVWD